MCDIKTQISRCFRQLLEIILVSREGGADRKHRVTVLGRMSLHSGHHEPGFQGSAVDEESANAENNM